METQSGFIKYILIIFAILAIVFLGQQALVRGIGKSVIFEASNQIKTYLAKGSSWALSAIYPKISGEVQSRGDAIKTEAGRAKQKITEDIPKKIENYFSGIADSILHPGKNNNCQTQPSQNLTNP